MFKKVITLALALVCLASFALVGVSAADAQVGDTITYTATLTTPNAIENIQATTTYTADTLKLIDATVAERFPNMTGVVANAADGAIYFNASEISTGFDFVGGKALVVLQFEVIAEGEIAVSTAIEEMVEFFGVDYVTGGEIVADGVAIADEITVDVVETTAPTTAAPTTVAPTTEAPTTVAPTTEAPTTEAPTTLIAEPTEAPTVTDVKGTTGTPGGDKTDVPVTGANVAIFAVLAVVAMAGAAVVVLRKKVNG